jgi:dephospho-CoA kinase
MTHIVGLTGGIGSGKSAVADLFAAQGVPVIDTDRIAHELTAAGGKALPAIVAAFGAQMIGTDGALNRAAMRQQVFANPSARKQLEEILHPLIRAESLRRIKNLSDTTSYAVLVVPLLIETGAYRELISRIAVVDCQEATQLARVMARNGLQQDEVERIMAAQATRAERLAAADDVIENGGDLAGLPEQIQVLHQTYTRLFSVKG